MVSRTETAISNNYRNSQEALYAADAAIERVVQDLLMVPRWNDILATVAAASRASRRVSRRGNPGTAITLPAGGKMTLNAATASMQAQTDAANVWGDNDPQWRLFAWGPSVRASRHDGHRQQHVRRGLGRR